MAAPNPVPVFARVSGRTTMQVTVVERRGEKNGEDLRQRLGAGVHPVAVEDLVGRDVRRADRTLFWRPPLLAEAPHLRELLLAHRDRIVVLAAGLDAQLCLRDAEALQLLQRNAGRVVTDSDEAAAALRSRLLAPVHVIDTIDGEPLARALVAVFGLTPGRPDTVEAHLADAQAWLARGDLLGAFRAGTRALTLAPDQPGVVADVARLLFRLGDHDRATALCRSFLAQRPDDAQVRLALEELASAPRADG